MKDINEYIQQLNIEEADELQIKLLTDALEQYFTAKEGITELTIKNRFGDIIPHPLIKVANDALIQVQKILRLFPTSPLDRKKINGEDKKEEESPLLQFMNEDEIEQR